MAGDLNRIEGNTKALTRVYDLSGGQYIMLGPLQNLTHVEACLASVRLVVPAWGKVGVVYVSTRLHETSGLFDIQWWANGSMQTSLKFGTSQLVDNTITPNWIYENNTGTDVSGIVFLYATVHGESAGPAGGIVVGNPSAFVKICLTAP